MRGRGVRTKNLTCVRETRTECGITIHRFAILPPVCTSVYACVYSIKATDSRKKEKELVETTVAR
jgi:hypothetical protein